MLRLHQTLAFLIWCFLLLQSAADEEAPWGPTSSTPSKGKPPENKQSSYGWMPAIRIPYYFWGSSSKEEIALTTTYKGLTDDQSDENSGSGDESISETSEPPTTLTQGLLTSVTHAHPTRISESAHSRTAHTDNDSLVSASYSSHARISSTNTVLTSPRSSTNAPEHSPAHTHATWGTEQAVRTSMGATERHTDRGKILLTTAEKTTFPTAFPWASAATFTTEVTTLTSQNLEPTNPENMFITTPQDFTVRYEQTTTTQDLPTQSKTTIGLVVQEGVATTALGIDGEPALESITSTTESLKVNIPIEGEVPVEENQKDENDQDVKEESVVPSETDQDEDTRFTDIFTPSNKLLTTPQQMSTETPQATPYTEWVSGPVESGITFLPDCNKEHTGVCNISDNWDATNTLNPVPTHNNTAMNESNSFFLIPASPLLVPLYTDWNSAMAVWGLAWEVHVYGLGCIFALLTLASALNLLCLPLRCPSGCGYFALVSLFLLAAGCTRSFCLLYDAYGHLDRLPSTEASLMLYEAPFPCLTAAFGLVFLLLSMRSRMQLSYSAFQRPCFLACLVALHFAAAFGPETLLKFYQQKQPLCLFFALVSRGAFVALATFLSSAYFVFYIYVRADSKHIYHLNNTSPTPAERYNRCPFAESRDWDRAAVTVCLSALFSLACAGLQLYAMLNAMGVAGGEKVFHPWPWWAFQFSCRLCELGVCLTLALVVAQPVYCSDHLPAAGSCWTELLASKSPILPGTYQWSLSQQEKLAIVDTVGLGETESLPLYTLMDDRFGNSLNGLDLLYHSNRALAYRDLDLDLHSSVKLGDVGGGEPSGGSSFTSDSTTDLRPPSPINLRRSIDEALFSEALFPMSLFSPRPVRCSDQSINNRCGLACNGLSDPLTSDVGLYRTSSCVEITSKPKGPGGTAQQDAVLSQSPTLSTSSSISSPERWGGSSSTCSLYRTSLGGSSLLLSPSPARQAPQSLQEGMSSHLRSSSQQDFADPQRHYNSLGTASQESLDLDVSSEADKSVQEEFINVCRQIDALSICSETIDL